MFKKLDSLNLFPSHIYRYHIDPLSYDKQEIVNSIIKNYNLSPIRNNWSGGSNLHHYYNDWNNTEYNKVDLSSLVICYNSLIQSFINSLDLKNLPNWNYSIQNITVCKEPDHFMEEHDHYSDNVIFSGVHYIRKNKEDSGLTFVNPLIVAQYPAIESLKWATTNLNSAIEDNSAFFKEWSIQPEEDEFIIFPSYLKHKVVQSKNKNDDYRIAVALNIRVFNH